jgi:hypothetical protein
MSSARPASGPISAVPKVYFGPGSTAISIRWISLGTSKGDRFAASRPSMVIRTTGAKWPNW